VDVQKTHELVPGMLKRSLVGKYLNNIKRLCLNYVLNREGCISIQQFFHRKAGSSLLSCEHIQVPLQFCDTMKGTITPSHVIVHVKKGEETL
jgi:hypothetical protein